MKDKISKCLNESYEGYGDFRCSKAVVLLDELFKRELLSFTSFLRENYHTEMESWSYNKLPLDKVQQKDSYDIVDIEEVLNKFLEDEQR